MKKSNKKCTNLKTAENLMAVERESLFIKQ